MGFFARYSDDPTREARQRAKAAFVAVQTLCVGGCGRAFGPFEDVGDMENHQALWPGWTFIRDGKYVFGDEWLLDAPVSLMCGECKGPDPELPPGKPWDWSDGTMGFCLGYLVFGCPPGSVDPVTHQLDPVKAGFHPIARIKPRFLSGRFRTAREALDDEGDDL